MFSGTPTYQAADAPQVEDCALDLRDFHEASHKLNIIPVLYATEAPAAPLFLDKAPGVSPLCRCNRATLSSFFLKLARIDNGSQLNAEIGMRLHIGPCPLKPLVRRGWLAENRPSALFAPYDLHV
jgi:hypothetical protein